MRIKTFKAYITFGLALFTSVAVAQELTLEQAIKQALEKNYGIQVAQNTAEIAQNNAHPGNAGLLPKVDANGGYTYTKGNTDLEFAGGIPPSSNDGAESKTLNGNITASYLLFDGLGVINNYKKLKEYSELGETQSRLAIESTLLQVSNLYYNIARMQENLAVAREALSISKDRYERAQARSDYGAPKILALNAQVDLNTDSSNVINLRMSLENLKRSLNVLLGRAADKQFTVSKDVTWDEGLALETIRQKAKENNTAVLVAAHNLYIAETDLKVARSGQFPRLAASASYGYTKQENDAGIVLSNTQIGFTGGITLSYNLFDGRRRHIQIQNAKIAIENNLARQEEAMLNVDKDVLNAWETFTQYRQLLQLEEQNLQTAQLNFERTKELFGVAQVNSTQFREAQLNLLRSQSRINDTRFSAKLAEIELTTLSGGLLKSN